MNLLANILVSGVLQLGLVPGHDLTLYQYRDLQESINISTTYIADYQATADIYKIGFITGGMTAYSFTTRAGSGFWPFRMDYKLGAGAHLGNYEIGWEHGCYHPIAPKWDSMPLPRIDAGQDFIYIKIKMGNRANGQ